MVRVVVGETQAALGEFVSQHHPSPGSDPEAPGRGA